MFGSLVHTSQAFLRFGLFTVLGLSASAAVMAQGHVVIDCGSGYAAGTADVVFSSFGEFIEKAGPVGNVYVYGHCAGGFLINGGELTIIGGESAEIDGNVTIINSPDGVYFLNVAITRSGGDGVNVEDSKVGLYFCSVVNNQGNGVSADKGSHVAIRGGSFSNNGGWAGGIHASGHSFVDIDGSGSVIIRGNSHSGIWATQSDISITGGTEISGNLQGPGIYLLGGSHAQIGDSAGTPNRIEENPNGGIQVLENSEVSLWACCSNRTQVVTRNGKFGILAGFHSQVTLSGADIYENSGPGVDVNTGSQLDFFPGTQNRIDGNGYQLPNPSPGVRVSGNSQAWLRAGEISNDAGSLGAGNQSPSISVGLNSSVDFAGVKLSSSAGTTNINSSGITCDFTSIASSDVQLNFTTGCILGGKLH